MKLSNLLLTAALFVSATIAFAKPKVDMSNVSDFLTMERSESTNTLNIKMFRMNNGWNYYVNGYTQGTGENADPVLSYRSLLSKDDQYLVSSDKSKIQKIIAGMENLPEDVRAGLNQHAIGIYEFSIPVTDDIIEIGLAGGNGNGAFVESVWQRSATNGNDFWSIGDGNIIYMGKGNWVGQYNNGAMFLVGGEPFGAPLPAPVVTLLIALGFGTALVMYRNRKQVKA